jgi:protein-disulfide isomerase
MSSHALGRRTRPGKRPSTRHRIARLVILPLCLALVVAAAGIGISLATSGGSGRPDTSSLRFVSEARAIFAGLPSRGSVVGYADAPVTIHEYADLRCPSCREWDTNILPDVVDSLVRTHQAKLSLEVWPILGENSVYASRAAYAAARQDRGWVYAEIAYMNQGDEQVDWFDPAFARASAVAAGLDLRAFDRDLADTRGSARAIGAVDGAARAAGFQGTPAIVAEGPGGRVELSRGGVPDLKAVSAAVRQVRSAS